MGQRRRRKPEDAVDKVLGEMTETAGAVTGDETLEAEGRAVQRGVERNTYSVVARSVGGWEVETGGTGRASKVYETKDEAVKRAKALARNNRPSQLLVYKKDGTVQAEQTYG